MGNYTSLKNIIDQYITTNGQGDITGAVLNDVLKSIVNSIGADFLFGGFVEPSSNVGSPDQNVFYIAIAGGTYTNFGNVVIPNGITIFKWNGSWSYQILFAGDGGVFDITAFHNGTKYADLSDALGNNGANVPELLRKGGMSVKFVHNSNNRYVQYRLMANAWSTTLTDWQGIDDTPTGDSNNLVKSGGVYEVINQFEMNSRFGPIELNVTFDDGYVIYDTGEKSTSSSYNNTTIAVQKDEIIQVRTDSSSVVAVIAAFDANNTYLKNLSVKSTGSVSAYEYIVPQGVEKIIVSVYNSASYKHIYKYGALLSKPEENAKLYTNNKIIQIASYQKDCWAETLNLTLDAGYFIHATGEIAVNSSYLHTPNYVAVKPGEKYVFLEDSSVVVGSVMAYDNNYNYLKDLSLAGTNEYRATEYIVPVGVAYLRFTLNNSENVTMFVSKVYTAKKNVVDAIDTRDCLENISLASGEEYRLYENYHKSDWIMQANFREIESGFTGIYVGKGLTYYSGGMAVRITPTHVQTLYNATNWYTSVEHGLNIQNYLDVRVESFVAKTDESASYTGDGDATFIKITLFDGVSEYTLDKAFFTGGGKPFIRIDGATCKANFYYWNSGLKRDLWCYGDSYFSIAQTRWPYWIITRGYVAHWNAKPGANSAFMWQNFARDLQRGNPRKVFWCLGMNDKDASDAANSSWVSNLKKVKDICRLRGIELVLCTIPEVPSTETSNIYKNEVVRTSGYPYVDFAAAVLKADGTGWFDGMMMDATHPSKTGARCLADAAMKLFVSYKAISEA